MIIDTFCFFNELDLLEIRLRELDSYVDKFVLVEADQTQSLLPKPFVFEENKDRFSDWMSKIEHVKVSDGPKVGGWAMEHFQRNCIRRGLDKLGLHDRDLVLISDLDEIPLVEAIEEARCGGANVFAVVMEFCAYYVNLRAKNRKWTGTVACPYGQIPSPQALRNMKDRLPVTHGGWHFSWLGGYQKIYEKALACIEPFDKSALPSEETFKSHFEQFLEADQKFFLHLENLDKRETEFELTTIDDGVYFPACILEDAKFDKYILR